MIGVRDLVKKYGELTAWENMEIHGVLYHVPRPSTDCAVRSSAARISRRSRARPCWRRPRARAPAVLLTLGARTFGRIQI